MRAFGFLGAYLVLLPLLLLGCGASGPPDLDLDPQPPTGGGVDPLPPPPGMPPGGGGGGPGTNPLAGGVLATFDASGEVFKAWTTDAVAIQQLEAAWSGTLVISQVGAPIRSGPGQGSHNLPWSWHLDPQLLLVDGTPPQYIWVPECYTQPSAVEASLNYFLTLIKSLAVTPVTLTNLQDFR